MDAAITTQPVFVLIILLLPLKVFFPSMKKLDVPVMLMPLILERQPEALAIAVEFHRSAFVTQEPGWPRLRKGKPEHLL